MRKVAGRKSLEDLRDKLKGMSGKEDDLTKEELFTLLLWVAEILDMAFFDLETH